jgi:hypothetical protein
MRDGKGADWHRTLACREFLQEATTSPLRSVGPFHNPSHSERDLSSYGALAQSRADWEYTPLQS